MLTNHRGMNACLGAGNTVRGPSSSCEELEAKGRGGQGELLPRLVLQAPDFSSASAGPSESGPTGAGWEAILEAAAVQRRSGLGGVPGPPGRKGLRPRVAGLGDAGARPARPKLLCLTGAALRFPAGTGAQPPVGLCGSRDKQDPPTGPPSAHRTAAGPGERGARRRVLQGSWPWGPPRPPPSPPRPPGAPGPRRRPRTSSWALGLQPSSEPTKHPSNALLGDTDSVLHKTVQSWYL